MLFISIMIKYQNPNYKVIEFRFETKNSWMSFALNWDLFAKLLSRSYSQIFLPARVRPIHDWRSSTLCCSWDWVLNFVRRSLSVVVSIHGIKLIPFQRLLQKRWKQVRWIRLLFSNGVADCCWIIFLINT